MSNMQWFESTPQVCQRALRRARAEGPGPRSAKPSLPHAGTAVQRVAESERQAERGGERETVKEGERLCFAVQREG